MQGVWSTPKANEKKLNATFKVKCNKKLGPTEMININLHCASGMQKVQ